MVEWLVTDLYHLQEHETAAEHKRCSYLFPSPLERVVADGKPDINGELEKMCVTLFDPSLPAGIWCTTGTPPPPPPPLLPTSPTSLHKHQTTHSPFQNTLLQLPVRADKMLKRHSSTLWVVNPHPHVHTFSSQMTHPFRPMSYFDSSESNLSTSL